MLFSEAIFSMLSGERAGIVGRNGSGKSSLFAAILGELSPEIGDIHIPKNLKVTSIAQHPSHLKRSAIDHTLDGDQRLRALEEQLANAQRHGHRGELLAKLYAEYEEAEGYSAPSRAGRILSGLGFSERDHHRDISSFSGGWQMRLNLARALMAPSDILLLDEPTNHLDLEATVWLEHWLARYRGTLLMISHDRDFLDGTVRHIFTIRNQRIEQYRGNYSTFERTFAMRQAHEATLHARQLEERARIQTFINRFKVKATKARQAQSRIKMLERMEIMANASIERSFRFAFSPPGRMPNPLLTLDGVSAGYAEQNVLSDINITLTPGQRIGVMGVNGAGKSTLIKLIHGTLAPREGRRIEHPGLNISYFAQHQLENLDYQASPKVLLGRIAHDTNEQILRNFLGDFGFGGDQYDTPCYHFSGGEKSRLILACLIWTRPNLLLLDEPTNHLDMEMRIALTLALQEFEGALILIAHDRHLLRTTTDELWMVANGQVRQYDGDISDYQSLQEALISRKEFDKKSPSSLSLLPTAPNAPRTEKKHHRREAAAHRERRQPLMLQSQELERAIEDHQAEINTIDNLLTEQLPANGNIEGSLKIRARLTAAKDQLEQTWLGIEERLEALDRSFHDRDS